VLKVHGHAAQFKVKHGNELTFDVIGYMGKRLGVRSGRSQHGNRHFASSFHINWISTHEVLAGPYAQAAGGAAALNPDPASTPNSSRLPATGYKLSYKLFIQPLRKRLKLLVAAEKIAHHLAPRF